MKRAFTIVELIVIIVIIGILASIALPNFFDLKFKSEVAKAKSEFNAINSRTKAYFLENIISGKGSESYEEFEDKNGFMFTNVFKDGLPAGTVDKGWYQTTNKTSVTDKSNYPIYHLLDGSYDPTKDYEAYLKQEKDRAGLTEKEIMIGYKYSISKDIFYNFLYRSKKAELVCVKAVCKGCNKSRKDTMNNMISCDTKA